MKKTLAILFALTLGLAPVSFAATALTDSELDQVSAGDWVILTDASGNQSVEDVYASNNTLDLQDESQKELKAVNNANAVDSAVAVQTNIASVEGAPTNNVGVNGTNEADIINYNPSDAGDSSSLYFTKEEGSVSIAKGGSFEASKSASYSAGTQYSNVETFDLVETLDVLAAKASASSTDCKKDCSSDSASVATLFIDYDKTIDKDKVELASTSKSASEEASLKASFFETEDVSTKSVHKKEESSSFRKNLGENNHLNLKDSSQQLIQVVSNLNAVGSGAAVQTNIASNVGVSGTITHVNTASVVNGL